MKRIIFGLAVALVASYGVANAQVIYEQTPIAEGATDGAGMTAYTSTTDLNPPPHAPSYPVTGRQDSRTFDSFTVGSAFSVKTVEWWGTYDRSAMGDLQKFHIAFWADGQMINGQPPTTGFPLASYDITGKAHQTAVGALAQGGDALGLFSYYAVLPSAFAPGAGTYWISIVGDVFAKDAQIGQPEEGLWQWWASNDGTAGVWQDTDVDVFGGNDDGVVALNEARYEFVGGNAAFRLNSAAIPEPASVLAWGVLALSGVGVTLVRRRRRSK